MTGRDSGAFRSSLALPEHRQLFDYWQSLGRDNQVPCRSDFDPAGVARLLPSLFLVDVTTPIADSTIRLAGTKLRETYQREITGLRIADFQLQENGDYWLEAYRSTVMDRRPVHGVVERRDRAGRLVAQHWLKLPLRHRKPDIDIVICFDIHIALAERTNAGKIATAS